MGSREIILSAVKANQPEKTALPDLSVFETQVKGSVQKFAVTLESVGGKISHVSSYEEIIGILLKQYGKEIRIVSPIDKLTDISRENLENIRSIHDLQDVGVAIIRAHFGVAENGAVWITEDDMQHRILPFITQHLVVVVNTDAIVPTMHEAYELISKATYGFGTFIAGPSKTADIEQSLVIGAHGPRSMTVFIISNNSPEEDVSDESC
jgi:L-lactate dehydrogenase complex protein LldG